MICKSVAEILNNHVTFELEAIDRMYLNGFVPSLQTGGGVVYFMKQRDAVSTALLRFAFLLSTPGATSVASLAGAVAVIAPGTRIGRYDVLAHVGAGAMGDVYKARDSRLDRVVALKVLRTSDDADAASRQRLLDTEARAISALNHPNICAVYDVGRHDDREFLVMEFVTGDTLAVRLAQAGVLGIGPDPISWTG